MDDARHLLLLIDYRQGQPLKEPVHVQHLEGDMYRVLYSPGLVQGVAGGDDICMLNDDGKFEVVRRGGNLAIQVFSNDPVESLRDELAQQVAKLDGVLDGAIEHGLVFTVPVAEGFPAIESVFNAWVDQHPGWEWYYGNVYDPNDGVTPLNWWES